MDKYIWKEEKTPNKEWVAKFLKMESPSDEIIFDDNTYNELMEFLETVTDEADKGIADIIWSGTIPLKDFVISPSVRGDKTNKVRFCIFEDAISNLSTMPKGRIGAVACMQELNHNTFSLLGMESGTQEINISKEFFTEDGEYAHDYDEETMYTVAELWKMWLGIQMALLHPKLKIILSEGKRVKTYSRVKDKKTGKRVRVVDYIKRHYIYDGDIVNTTREFTRHCKAWYVIGHWRHYSDGKIVYVKGHWKGEMREFKKNLDDGRMRNIELDDGTVEEIINE